jgi:chromosome segregation ATPase
MEHIVKLMEALPITSVLTVLLALLIAVTLYTLKRFLKEHDEILKSIKYLRENSVRRDELKEFPTKDFCKKNMEFCMQEREHTADRLEDGTQVMDQLLEAINKLNNNINELSSRVEAGFRKGDRINEAIANLQVGICKRLDMGEECEEVKEVLKRLKHEAMFGEPPRTRKDD